MSGMVLSSAPYGEYDRRVVLLTKEAGKITAFARSARKPTSPLVSATSPFNAGTFSLYPGRSAYTLAGAKISNYFEKLKEDLNGTCYGSYFMELAGYYGRENLEAGDLLSLLYVSLLALEKPALPNRLVRCIFETKLMVIGGEFPEAVAEDAQLDPSAAYALKFIIASPIKKLYTFSVTDEVLRQMCDVVDRVRERTIDTRLKSLEILEAMVE